MNFKQFCILSIMLYSFNYLFAQQEPQYIDDLDKEFRYKVEGVDLNDRGIKFFKQDLENELNRLSIFKKNNQSIEQVRFMINFRDTIVLEHIGIYGFDRKSVVENRDKKINELTRILEKLKYNWKPAEYLGEKYLGKSINSISFNINKDNNSKVSISELKFGITKERYVLNANCFKTIELKSMYQDPFFYATEIQAEYKGGTKMLKSNINALLKPIKVEKVLIDYFTVDFAILKDKKIAYFNTYNPSNQVEALIADKMKLLSCNWKPALQGGRPVNQVLSYKFYYSYTLDDNQQRRNIEILDIITRDVPMKTKIVNDY